MHTYVCIYTICYTHIHFSFIIVIIGVVVVDFIVFAVGGHFDWFYFLFLFLFVFLDIVIVTSFILQRNVNIKQDLYFMLVLVLYVTYRYNPGVLVQILYLKTIYSFYRLWGYFDGGFVYQKRRKKKLKEKNW